MNNNIWVMITQCKMKPKLLMLFEVSVDYTKSNLFISEHVLNDGVQSRL